MSLKAKHGSSAPPAPAEPVAPVLWGLWLPLPLPLPLPDPAPLGGLVSIRGSVGLRWRPPGARTLLEGVTAVLTEVCFRHFATLLSSDMCPRTRESLSASDSE